MGDVIIEEVGGLVLGSGVRVYTYRFLNIASMLALALIFWDCIVWGLGFSFGGSRASVNIYIYISIYIHI